MINLACATQHAPKNCSHRRTVRTVAVDSLACAASASASVSAPSVSSIGHVARQLVLCDHNRGACPEAESAYHAQLAARKDSEISRGPRRARSNRAQELSRLRPAHPSVRPALRVACSAAGRAVAGVGGRPSLHEL